MLAALLVLVGATVVAVAGAPERAEAAVVKSFTPRFRTNERGDVYAIGNTLVSCSSLALGCAAARAGSGSNVDNNDFVGTYVDVDGNLATSNSSQATLTLPTGGAVLWAGLYWAGSAGASVTSRRTIQLAGPSGDYTTINGAVTTGVATTTGGVPYAGFADVTSLVQTSGTYTVGGLTTTVGAANSRGGWSLIVVVRDTTQPLRNLSVFDGYAEINSSAADSVVTTNVSGFLTPTTGTVTARVGAVTSEGDLGLTGDQFSVNGNVLSNGLSPSTNFWNSSISRLGTRLSAKNPDYVNQMGFDVDYLQVPAGVIGNSQTSATLRFTTGGESYEPIALFTAIDIFEPNMSVTKTAAAVPSSTKLNPGDTIEYTIRATSSGSEPAATSIVSDPLPAGVTYVPGSITIDGTTVTDAAADDRAEYLAASRTVRARIGTGANASSGGSLAVNSSVVVRFRVTVDADPPAGLQVANQASVAYASPTTGTAYATLSDDPDVNGVPNATAFDVNDPPVTNPVTASTNEDTPLTVDVGAVTSDPDDAALTYALVTGPPAGQGSVSCTTAGVCTYTPAANFAGTTTFTYRATDTGGLSSTSTVTITVVAVNDPPVAANDAVTTDEDTPVNVTVSANDSDVDGGALTVSAFTQGTRGTVTCVAPAGGTGPCTSGALRYVPNADANGTDAFTYVVSDGNGGTATATVNVTITAVNDAPTATSGTATTTEDTPISVNVLDGDSDKDGDAVRLLSFTQPSVGTVSCTANTGPCTFTPPANFTGTTAYTYTITDRPGAGGLTSTATVTVTVTPVNDRPIGVGDVAATPEDTATTIAVLANDSDVDGDTLRVVSFTQPLNGSVTCVSPAGGTGPCAAGSALRYVPNANVSGSDPFTYELGDGNGGQSTVAVTVSVTPVNDAPTAVNDAVTTGEDTPVQISVLANDSDLEGNTLTISAVTQPPSGSVTCTATTCTFTPAANATGATSFTYTVSDGNGGTATATVTVTVNAVNDPPVATGNLVAGTEDTTTLPFDLIGDDTDVDNPNATLVITALSAPSKGTVSCGALPGRGPCTYTPFANSNGVDTFTYTIRDPGGLTATATVIVSIDAVNDPPVAPDSTYDTTEDTAVTIDLTRNVTDIDGGALTYAVTTPPPPAAGALSCPTPSTCSFTPAADFNGTTSFVFTVSDGNGGTDTATVTVTVAGVNDPPTATPAAVTTNEDAPVTLDPRAGDTDPDGDPLTIVANSSPTNGTATCSATSCTYTPNPNVNGTDSFTYTVSDGRGGTATATVTVTVAPVNDVPVAVDDVATTAEDTDLVLDVRANDRDVDGDTLSVTVTTPPPAAQGTVACTAAGSCTFDPAVNFNGTTSFTYQVADGNGGTATAVARITVTPVNDAPIAIGNTATTAEDTASAPIDVVANDTDVDNPNSALTITALGQPANGTVTCGTLPGRGPCIYTPNPNFNGTDTFTYVISDGSGRTSVTPGVVTLTVTAVNDAPTADADSAVTDEDTAVDVNVADGDADIDGPSLTWAVATQPANGTAACTAAGVCTYTPNPNVGGLDSFTYTVSDGTASATATVTVLVRAVNDAPVAVDDTATTPEDTAVDIDVLGDDTDPDGDPLTIRSFTQPATGTVTCVAPAGGAGPCTGADLRFAPNRNFNGTATFTYIVGDGSGASDAGSVTVTVASVNDAPVGNDRTVTTAEESPTGPIDVLAGASDVDGDTITLLELTAAPPAAQGTVACDLAAGTCVFTPATDFIGASSFTVTLSDGNGGSDTVTVDVTVTPVNDPPVAAGDTATVDEDGSVTLDPRVNDTDADGDALAIVAGTRATTNGSVTCTTTACTYTPRANFNGNDSFTYDVSDPSGATVTGTVTVTVTSVNDPPVAVDLTRATPEDAEVDIGLDVLLRPELDPDRDDLTLTSFTAPLPTQGTFTCTEGPPAGPTTTCTFVPAENFTGAVVIPYEIDDGEGGTDTGTITIDVGATNDSPTPATDTVTVVEDTPTDVDVLANDTDPDAGDTFEIVPVTGAPTRAGGSVTCSAALCSYTPPPDYNGADSFTYQVVDAAGAVGTATVDVTVTAVNDPPNPGDGPGVTNEDTPLTVPVSFVLANDTDPDPGDTITAIAFSQPPATTGSVVCRRGGVTIDTGPFEPTDLCTFTPAPNFNGTTSFTYTTEDTAGATTVSTITVTVVPVNDAPVATADAATTPEDTPVDVGVLGNDTDVDAGDTRTIQFFSQPASGTVRCVEPIGGNGPCATGGLRYVPNDNFAGTDTFSYVVADAAGTTATATVTVTVEPVNDPPVATDGDVETDEETPLTFEPADGDVDIDGPPPVLVAVGTPGNGTVECDFGTGLCTYTPDAGFNGADSFTYTIRDSGGLEATATVSVTVNAVNDLPVAVADAAAVDEDGFVDVDPVGNDTDADGDPLTITGFAQPTNGTVSCVPATGVCRYTPFANFNGADSFTYTVSDGQGGSATATVTVTVASVNDPPVAPDRQFTFAEGSPGVIGLRTGATDVDHAAGSLAVTAVSPGVPPFGSWNCAPPAITCTFDPGPDAFGSFDVAVTIADPAGATTTRTITVNVVPVADPPRPVVAAATTSEDEAVAIDVLAGATDPDPGDTVTLVGYTQGGRGAVDCDLGTGVCTYTPEPDFNGVDTFTYTVTDDDGNDVTRVVTVTVAPVNDAPVADDVLVAVDEDTAVALDLLAGASDIDQPAGTSLTATVTVAPTLGTLDCSANPDCTYTPDAGVSGTDTFTVRVTDDAGGVADRVFTIEIASVNDAPTAGDDTATADEDTAVTVSVLTNDDDADGDTITIISFTSPSSGTVTCSSPAGGAGPCLGDGLRYVPNADVNGTDSFTYTIGDGAGGTATATVTVTVRAVNDPPRSTAGPLTTGEDTPVSFDPLDGTSDVDGDPVTLVGIPEVVTPDAGVITCSAGTCTFTPSADVSGPVTIRYTITDGNGASTVVTRTIDVVGAQDPPVPALTSAAVDEDAFVDLDLLDGATDPDGDVPTLVATTQPANGTLVQQGDGTWRYTPNPNVSGTDTFTYTITDGNGNDVTTTVTVTVRPQPDAPTPGSGSASTPEDTPINVPVSFILANDTDPDGDPFEAISFEQPAPGTGTAACYRDGVLLTSGPYLLTDICRFTPAPDFVGTTSFDYTVRDSTGRTGTATITVIVAAVDDPPIVVDEAVTTPEDTPIDVDVIANDRDVDDAQGDLRIVAVTQPQNGTVDCGPLPGRGPCRYTPGENDNGPDAFTYIIGGPGGTTTAGTVTISVTAVDDAPVASDRTIGTLEDTPVTFNGLDGVIDPDGTAVRLVEVSQPANGTVDCDLDTGECTYTPDPDFAGTDPVTVTVGVVDATGAESTYTITFEVTAVDDAPVGTPDAVTIDEDSPAVPIEVLANDVDPEGAPLTIVGFTQPSLGTVTCTPTNPCTYTPRPDVNGTDTFTYVVSDGALETTVVVTVTIAPVADPPAVVDDVAVTDEDTEVVLNVLVNDTDPDGGTPGLVTVVRPPSRGSVRPVGPNGELAYIPDPNVAGTDSFEYRACDPEGACDTATVTITVVPVADDPIAEDLTGVTTRGQPVTVNPLDTASDPDGDLDPTSLALTTAPLNGTAVLDPVTGAITYTPDPGFVGTDQFEYTICDLRDVCVVKLVNIEVLAPDDPPVAVADAVEDPPDTAIEIEVLANDRSPDGDLLDPASVRIVGGPASGTATVDPATGIVTYTPDRGFSGTDTFTYEVCEVPGEEQEGEGAPTPTEPQCSSADVTVVVDAQVPPSSTTTTTVVPGEPSTTTTAPPTSSSRPRRRVGSGRPRRPPIASRCAVPTSRTRRPSEPSPPARPSSTATGTASRARPRAAGVAVGAARCPAPARPWRGSLPSPPCWWASARRCARPGDAPR